MEAPPSPPNRTPLPRQSQVFFLAILATLFFLSWLLFRPFVIFMVTGVFVAVLSLPIDKYWERTFPNRVSAFLTMFSLLLIILIPLAALGFALASDASELADNLQDGGAQKYVIRTLEQPLTQQVLAALYPQNTSDERNATVQLLLEESEGLAIEYLKDISLSVVQRVPDFFLALTVILFVVYYVLTDGERLVAYLRRAAPLPARQVTRLLSEAHDGLRAVFVGQIVTSLIQGALGGIGFLVVGLPGAVIWASVMAVLSLLPVVGAFIVWVPAALFLFVQAANGDIPLWKPIALTIWGFVVVSQVDNFVRPKLIGDRANIHPLFVLIGVLGGVAAFGFVGLFLGPLLVGITISILRVWESDYLEPSLGHDDPTWEDTPIRPRNRKVARQERKATRAARKQAKRAETNKPSAPAPDAPAAGDPSSMDEEGEKRD